MKLSSTFAILAVLLLIGNEAVLCQGWNLFGKSEKENKTVIQNDEEVLSNIDEEKAVDDLDRDYSESVNAKSSQAKLEGALMDNDDKVKYDIDDPLTNIATISELAPQNQTNFVSYDRTPEQSPFVDNAPHPTQSQGIDPRFVNRQPRQCSDGQYLCTKATPTQEHVRCIPDEWKCNGVRDCENNDDEDGCGMNHHRPQPNGCVAGYQYQCYGTGINGLPAMCIDVSKKCNGVYDCTYGDDENKDNCPTGPAHREEEPVQKVATPPTHHQTRPVHSAPTYYHSEQTHQPSQQPTPHHQAVVNCPNEEHYNRLAWTDRCIRTCISRSNSNNHHNGRV